MMRPKNFETIPILLLLCTLFLFLLVNFSLVLKNYEYLTSHPDENIYYYFVKHYARTGELGVESEVAILTNGLAKPRSTEFYNGKIVPRMFIGENIVYGLLYRWLGNKILLVNPLLALCGGYYLFRIFYLLVDSIARKRILIASLVAITSPVYFNLSQRAFFNSIPAFVFWLAFAFYQLKYFKSDNKRIVDLIIAGIFLGLSFSFRYTVLISSAVLFLTYFLKVFMVEKKFSFLRYYSKAVLLVSLVSLLVVTPVLIANKELYSDYFRTGYNLRRVSRNSTQELDNGIAALLSTRLNTKLIIPHLKVHILPFIHFIVLGIAGGIMIFKKVKSKVAFLSLLIPCFIDVLFYFTQSPSGFNVQNPQFDLISSPFRYLTLFYLFTAFLGVLYVLELPLRKYSKSLIVSLFFLTNICFVFNAYHGIADYVKNVRENNEFLERVQQVVGQRADRTVFLTGVEDKILSIYYNVIPTADVFPDNADAINKLNEGNYEVLIQKEVYRQMRDMYPVQLEKAEVVNYGGNLLLLKGL
ncbi:glycosyltransferase family 39 protein [Patescibacteria group bacterium]|nr:glycosyltransferase family 39 protein [Patescibacteria group bacterium]MBU1868566.1 glycosyltransferase family 39 protein [Patescibacteria group bacterium]